MIQLKITETAKGYHPSEEWYIMDCRTESFKSVGDAMQWIKDTYGNRKRRKMYIDTEPEPIHVGYIIGFRNCDISHLPLVKWLQQDWIEFTEVKPINLN